MPAPAPAPVLVPVLGPFRAGVGAGVGGAASGAGAGAGRFRGVWGTLFWVLLGAFGLGFGFGFVCRFVVFVRGGILYCIDWVGLTLMMTMRIKRSLVCVVEGTLHSQCRVSSSSQSVSQSLFECPSCIDDRQQNGQIRQLLSSCLLTGERKKDDDAALGKDRQCIDAVYVYLPLFVRLKRD